MANFQRINTAVKNCGKTDNGHWTEAHHVADRIETRLKKDIRNVDDVTIHYEPITAARLGA